MNPLINEQLKTFKESRNLTQRELAVKLDVSEVTINRWLNGKPIGNAWSKLITQFLNRNK